ncbi:MAG: ExbD/TolR family protein [Paracoccaceae bacterium]
MTMRRRLPETEQKARPDVSLAIVNIVLLLIFFFLATGSLTSAPTRAVEVSETFDLPVEQLPHPILIVEGDDSISLNGESIDLDALSAALEGETVLHVMIAREAPAHELLALLTRPDLKAFDVRLVTIHRRSGS